MLEVIIGLLTGIISGLGIGGGTVLMIYMALTGYDHFNAVGINLTYFVFCAIPVVIKNIKDKRLDISVLLWIAIPATAVSVVVTLVVSGIDSSILRRIFGLFSISVGARELLRKRNNERS